MKGLADVQVTLYDIFGYFLVGIVAVCSLSIFGWAVLFPGGHLTEPSLSSSAWFAVLIASYIVGHLIQAIANKVFEHSSLKPLAHEAWEWMPAQLRAGIVTHAKAGTLPATADPAVKEAYAFKLFEVCDIVDSQKAVAGGDREIYQYREGFYRGLTIAFALGIVAVAFRAFHTGDAIVGRHHKVTNLEYALLFALLALGTSLAYHRYKRFFGLKLHNAYGSFALITGVIELPKS